MRPKILRRKHYLYCQNQSKVFLTRTFWIRFFCRVILKQPLYPVILNEVKNLLKYGTLKCAARNFSRARAAHFSIFDDASSTHSKILHNSFKKTSFLYEQKRSFKVNRFFCGATLYNLLKINKSHFLHFTKNAMNTNDRLSNI